MVHTDGAGKRCHTFVQWTTADASQVLIQILNLCDLYVSIAMAYPSVQIPTLLDILLPFNHHASSATLPLRVTPLFILGTAICSFGSLLRLACYRHLGRYFTLELALLKDHRLITDGPYAYVRHPAYLGAVGFCAGLLIYQHSAGSWWAEAHIWSSTWGKLVGVVWLSYVTFCIVSVIFIRVAKEDEVLRSTFGDEWVEWSKRTPYKIFPGIY